MMAVWLIAYSLQLTAAPAPVPYQSVTVPGYANHQHIERGGTFVGGTYRFVEVPDYDGTSPMYTDAATTWVWVPGKPVVLLADEQYEALSADGKWLMTVHRPVIANRTTTELRVRYVPSLLLPDADFDGDGDVDMTDFGVLQRNLGGSDSRFDLNGDGAVDGLDVDVFGKMRVR